MHLEQEEIEAIQAMIAAVDTEQRNGTWAKLKAVLKKLLQIPGEFGEIMNEIIDENIAEDAQFIEDVKVEKTALIRKHAAAQEQTNQEA